MSYCRPPDHKKLVVLSCQYLGFEITQILLIFNTFCMLSWDVRSFVWVGEGGLHICIKHSSSNLWPISSCVTVAYEMTNFLSVKH